MNYRFGREPRSADDFIFLGEYWESMDKLTLPPAYRELARDSYDNCVAYLDERLGELLEHLLRSGVLDDTLVILTSDHGEGLGEHGLFNHGESLYRPEIRVPLLIMMPSNSRMTGHVPNTVSLRDLPATIVDLVGLRHESPFPGRSLARFWREPSDPSNHSSGDEVISELSKPNPYDPNQGRSPRRGPLISLAEDGFVYIRNQVTEPRNSTSSSRTRANRETSSSPTRCRPCWSVSVVISIKSRPSPSLTQPTPRTAGAIGLR